MKENIQNAIAKIAQDRLLGNIISDDDLITLCELEDKTVVWDLLIKQQKKIKKKDMKENPQKAVNDIYNTQLLYWTICEIDIDEIRKKQFYDSLMEKYKVR